eukprot:13257484-Alexandrium_andersonii.AAC.1
MLSASVTVVRAYRASGGTILGPRPIPARPRGQSAKTASLWAACSGSKGLQPSYSGLVAQLAS